MCAEYFSAARVEVTPANSMHFKQNICQPGFVSALLFIAVLESCMRELKKKWGKLNARRMGKSYGMPVDSDDDPVQSLPP